MKICNLVCSVGRTGYFNKDLAAIKAGAVPDGFSYDGAPVTPGFRRVIEPGASISVMLVLDDGQVGFGDCVDVIFTGAAGRDPIFRPEKHLPLLEKEITELLVGRDCDSFRPLADAIEGLRPAGKPLHTALRYGISQALLHASALANRETIAELIAREYGCDIAAAPVPILSMCPTDQLKQVDKMIMKRADMLPHGSFGNVRELGTDGVHLLDYAGWIADRVRKLGGADYHPGIHLDVYGTVGELFDHDAERMAAFLGKVRERVAPYDLYFETPVIADSRAAQIAMFQELRAALRRQGHDIKLIADEWCNTLDDIKTFADAQAADYIQVKTPDLGGLGNSIEALLYCRAKGIGPYIGGTGNETDQSARICTHVALACRADFMLCKPGQGVDEGLLIQTNEMKRTLALIAARAGGV